MIGIAAPKTNAFEQCRVRTHQAVPSLGIPPGELRPDRIEPLVKISKPAGIESVSKCIVAALVGDRCPHLECGENHPVIFGAVALARATAGPASRIPIILPLREMSCERRFVHWPEEAN